MIVIPPGSSELKAGRILDHQSKGNKVYRIAIENYTVKDYTDGDILFNVVDGSWKTKEVDDFTSRFTQR